jgi:hypothetical protein
MGFVMDSMIMGEVFLKYLGFSISIFIPPVPCIYLSWAGAAASNVNG